jgi:hypothetical protein
MNEVIVTIRNEGCSSTADLENVHTWQGAGACVGVYKRGSSTMLNVELDDEDKIS